MIAGLEDPTSGEIAIDGRPANDLEPAQRNIGMVFQNLALFPHKTVYDNIAFGLRVKKVPAAAIRVQVGAGGQYHAHRTPPGQAALSSAAAVRPSGWRWPVPW